MQVLNFNTGINFGAKGNLKEFDPVGFSAAPDDVSTWSEASVAELSFRLPPLRHDVRFTIEVFPFLAGGVIPQQGCFVYFNGLFVHYHAIRTPVELTFTVSRDDLNPRANRLSFALPNATSPKELNVGNDLRQLGLGFVKLSAADATAAAPQPRLKSEPVDRRGAPSPAPATPVASPESARAEPEDRGNRSMPNPAARFGARDNAVPARPEPSKGLRARDNAAPARPEPPKDRRSPS